MSDVLIRPEERRQSDAAFSGADTSRALHPDAGLSPATRRNELFPASVLTTPMVDGKDIAAFVGAAIITLGPLAAYSLGLGA